MTTLSTFSDFERLQGQWENLAEQDHEAGIFNDWTWNFRWWVHYGDLGRLNIVLIHLDGELVGIAPFYITRTRVLGFLPVHALKFIGSGGDTSPDDLNVIAIPEHKHAVVQVVCEYLFSTDTPAKVQLNDVPVNSVLFDAFQSFRFNGHGYRTPPRVDSRRWAHLPENWKAYTAGLSRNSRKQMKRRSNRLREAGEATFSVCKTEDDLSDVSKALTELHSKRWQSKGVGGAFSSSEYKGFHADIMHDFFKQKQLWLMSLSLNGNIIGVEYAFEYKKTLMFFQTGFDPAQQRLSPGHLMMQFAIQRAIDEGLDCIDLLKGDYEYKASYANKTRETACLRFCQGGLISRMSWLADKLRGRN